MGKTYTSILISENFNNIVILSPLRTYACQLLDVFCKKLKTHTSNLISSDGSRDLNIILNNKHNKIVNVSLKFKSVKFSAKETKIIPNNNVNLIPKPYK